MALGIALVCETAAVSPVGAYGGACSMFAR